MVFKVIGVLIFLAICYSIWQCWELRQFEVTKYEIASPKLTGEHRFVVLADLHGYRYGKGNSRLLEKIRQLEPQFILIAGDMIVSKEMDTYERASEALGQLAAIAPVYYAMGNHESRVNKEGMYAYPAFMEYQKKAMRQGTRFLQNESQVLHLGKDAVCISGLEIDLDYYEKGTMVPMDVSYIESLLGSPSEDFSILLAHNPAYSPQYAQWGADLTFCGHNHGGLIRLPGIGSLISPQLTLFPRYNDGCHEIKGKRVIISRGLGTHTFHIRIFNRAELVAVKLLPASAQKGDGNFQKRGRKSWS